VNNATWPAATRQGTVAGWNMAGGNRTYIHNFTMNALNLFGFWVMVAGHAYLQECLEMDISQEEGEGCYRKIVVKSGRVIGFILIGDISIELDETEKRDILFFSRSFVPLPFSSTLSSSKPWLLPWHSLR
jgi:hypothetical protein